MSKETIGSNLPQGVVTQIRNRENLLRSSGADQLSSRLQVLNSSTGWVKLYSGVNRILDSALNQIQSTGEIPAYPEFAKSIYRGNGVGYNPYQTRKLYEQFYLQEDLVVPSSDELAAGFVLSSGKSNIRTETVNSGIEWDKNKEKTGTYNTWDSLGLRPVPGITSATISSRNTYGTLQQAEISFTVWTVEELDMCELIYFRPGYSALLEWGHTSFLGNETIPKTYSAQTYPYRRVGTSFFQSENSKAVEESIEVNRNTTGGNYDAMFGFITNFSWKFRQDGGYDCTLRVVSKGIVLESLKINAASFGYTVKEESDQEKQSSVFHRIFNTLENASRDQNTTIAETLATSPELTPGLQRVLNSLSPCPVFNTQGTFTSEDGETTQRLAYIPLRIFLEILNLTVLLKAGGTLDTVENIVSFRTKNGSDFLTFAEHYSLNPLVAVPAFQPVGNAVISSFSINGLHPLMQSYALERGGRFEIMNIMLSTTFLKKEIEKVVDSENSENNTVYSMVESILNGIQEALGNINKFEILYQEEKYIQKEGGTVELQPAEYVIADRNAIILEDVKNIPEIQISGVGSSIIDLQVESKISNEAASQVAIAAQGSTGNYRENLEAILRWNMGAIDRHYPIKRTVKEPTGPRNSISGSLYKTLSDLWSRFNNVINTSQTQTQAQAQAQAEKYAKEHGVVLGSAESKKWGDVFGAGCEDLNNLYKAKLAKQGHTPPSPIPVELSLKMMGISGFKIGTMFKISGKVLPSSYRHFGFLVTGVEHSIENSQKWTTSVKTQYYPLPQIQGIKDVLGISTVEQDLTPSLSNQPKDQSNTPNANRLRQWIRTFGEGRISEPDGKALTTDGQGQIGDISAPMAELAITVFINLKKELRDRNIYIRITSGKRSFNTLKNTDSRHLTGNAIDFTISDTSGTAQEAIEKVLEGVILLPEARTVNLRYLNEYREKIDGKLNNVFHISVFSKTEGQKNFDRAQERFKDFFKNKKQ